MDYETTADADSGSGSDFYGADPDYIYDRRLLNATVDFDLDYVFVYTWIFFMMNMLF